MAAEVGPFVPSAKIEITEKDGTWKATTKEKEVVVWGREPFLGLGERQLLMMKFESPESKDRWELIFAHQGTEISFGEPKVGQGPTRCGFNPSSYSFFYVGPKSTAGGTNITVEFPAKKGTPFVVYADGRSVQAGLRFAAVAVEGKRSTGPIAPLGVHHKPPELWPPPQGSKGLFFVVKLPTMGSSITFYTQSAVPSNVSDLDCKTFWGLEHPLLAAQKVEDDPPATKVLDDAPLTPPPTPPADLNSLSGNAPSTPPGGGWPDSDPFDEAVVAAASDQMDVDPSNQANQANPSNCQFQ